MRMKGGENMSFHEKLRALREDRDMNQTELAKILNIKQQRVSQIELGNSEPTTEEIRKICRYFGVSADELLELS